MSVPGIVLFALLMQGAGQGAGESAQVWQMRRNFLGDRHGDVLIKRAGNEDSERLADKRFIFRKSRNLLRKHLLNGTIRVGFCPWGPKTDVVGGTGPAGKAGPMFARGPK